MQNQNLHPTSNQAVCMWTVISTAHAAGASTLATGLKAILESANGQVTFAELGELKQPATGLPAQVAFHPQAFMGALEANFRANLHQIIKKAEVLLKPISLSEQNNIILDLGPSLSQHALDLFMSADMPLIVMNPSIDSLERLFNLFKLIYIRALDVFISDAAAVECIQQLRNEKVDIKKFKDLLKTLQSKAPERYNEMQEFVQKFSPKVIINKSQGDLELFWEKFSNSPLPYFFNGLTLLGSLPYEQRSANLLYEIIRQNTIGDKDRRTILDTIEAKLQDKRHIRQEI